jgi:hypothetical protein
VQGNELDHLRSSLPGTGPLRLQLALDLVEEAPVSAIGDERVGVRLDHAQLVQPQRIEAQCVLGVVIAPDDVADLPQRLDRVIVPVGEPSVD